MSASELPTDRCPRCGSELLPEAPGGVCAACALGEALAEARPGPPGDDDSEFLFLHDIPTPGQKVRCVGDYELLEPIARGGMGVVYKARQRRLNRVVALKLMLGREHSNEAFRKRFRQEAELAAKLQHPNIVPIYEVGEHEGEPFFSMEYVAGSDLGRLTRGQPLPPKQAAEQVKTVAEAIHHAHQRGVLHRDLKPSNILIGADGRPRITDFGLARQLDTQSSVTITGDMLGTPGFLPPEQVAVKKGAIGPASDVYSLGAVLYQLLTGRPPFMADTVPQILRMVEESPAPAPRKHRPEIPVDLETICLKCLEKEPARRYASAQLLAEDLGRFLCDEPILARPASSVGRLWRWSRRKPVVAGLLCTIVVIGVGFGLLWHIRNREKKHRDQEQMVERLKAADQDLTSEKIPEGLGLLAQELRHNRSNRVAAERLLNALASRSLPIATQSYSDPLVQTGMWSENGRAVLIAGAGWSKADSKGGRQVSHEEEGSLALLEIESGNVRRLEVRGSVSAIAVNTGVLFAAAEQGGAVRVWLRAESQASLVLTNSGAAAWHLIFLSENKLIGLSTNQIGVWSLPDGEFHPWLVAEAELKPFSRSAWNPSVRRLAVADFDGHIHVLDANSGHRLRTLTNDNQAVIRALAFSPDGHQLVSAGAASAGAGGDMSLWNVAAGLMLARSTGQKSAFLHVQFSPDGGHLATASLDGKVQLWNVTDLKAPIMEPLKGDPKLEPGVNALTFSPDGAELLAAGEDKTVRIWKVATGKLATEVARFEQPVLHAAFSPGGDRILALVADAGAVVLWRTIPETPLPVTDGPPIGMLAEARSEKANYEKGHKAGITFADISPNARLIATASEDGTACVWSRRNRRRLILLRHKDGVSVNCVRFSQDGRRLVTSTSGREFRVWDVETGLPLTDWISPGSPVSKVSFGSEDRQVFFAENRAWPILLVQQPLPPWLAELAETIGDLQGIAQSKDGQASSKSFSEACAKLKLADPAEPWISWLQHYLQCEAKAH